MDVDVLDWLSGMTRNHVGSSHAGSNPVVHIIFHWEMHRVFPLAGLNPARDMHMLIIRIIISTNINSGVEEEYNWDNDTKYGPRMLTGAYSCVVGLGQGNIIAERYKI